MENLLSVANTDPATFFNFTAMKSKVTKFIGQYVIVRNI